MHCFCMQVKRNERLRIQKNNFTAKCKYYSHTYERGPRQHSRYSYSLQVGRFGVRAPVGAKNFLFFMSIQTSPGIYPAFCKVGRPIGAFSRALSGCGVASTNHSNLASRLRMNSLTNPLPSQSQNVMGRMLLMKGTVIPQIIWVSNGRVIISEQCGGMSIGRKQ